MSAMDIWKFRHGDICILPSLSVIAQFFILPDSAALKSKLQFALEKTGCAIMGSPLAWEHIVSVGKQLPILDAILFGYEWSAVMAGCREC